MKKNLRAPVANPESKGRRALRLTHETVRVLSPTDLAHAVAGGSGCITTTDPTVRTNGTTGGG
jgi:hypothetical protein